MLSWRLKPRCAPLVQSRRYLALALAGSVACLVLQSRCLGQFHFRLDTSTTLAEASPQPRSRLLSRFARMRVVKTSFALHFHGWHGSCFVPFSQRDTQPGVAKDGNHETANR
jgi:hypothetical protein